MPYVAIPSDAMVDELRRLEEKILLALKDEDKGLTAHACLMIAVSIWSLGDVTNEQAKQVANAAIDQFIVARTN